MAEWGAANGERWRWRSFLMPPTSNPFRAFAARQPRPEEGYVVGRVDQACGHKSFSRSLLKGANWGPATLTEAITREAWVRGIGAATEEGA